MRYIWHYESPLGGMTMASDGSGLTGLWFDGQKYYPEGIVFAEPEETDKGLPTGAIHVFRETERWLDIYFSGQRPAFTPPLAVRGSAFQEAVWKLLREIPYGETTTYGQLAARLGEKDIKGSAQAVGGAVGHSGRMSVIKDLGMKKQYIGQSELVSGEIAMDFANYFTVSEQQPSLVALGVLVNGNTVLKAGGLLIQPLPGCPDEIIDQLELRSPMFADISREMTFAPIEQLCEDWFRGLEPRILERTPLRYRCTCSRERMEKALISLGRKDLRSLIDEDQGAELVCHFCRSRYNFSTADLNAMMARAVKGEAET